MAKRNPRPKVTPKKAAPPKSAGEWKPAFLRALANSANVRAACLAAGISRKTAYKHKGTNAQFAAAWDDAMEDACDVLEGIARQRAAASSDLLLIFMLKAHRPDKFRENLKVDLNQRGTLQIVEEIIDDTGDRQKDHPAAPGSV